MEQQCIICGGGEVFLKNLCKDCFTSRHSLLTIKNKLNLTICYFCSSARVKKSWVEFRDKDAAVRDCVKRNLEKGSGVTRVKMDIDLSFVDEHALRAVIEAQVSMDDETVDETVETLVNVTTSVCDNCSRAVGNYYEAILQLRSENRPMFPDEQKEATDIIIKAVAEEGRRDNTVFISKTVELKTGTDFYLSSTKTGLNLMKKLTKKYGAKTKQSSSLVGRKEGKDLHRITYLVRLPDWRVGDVVCIDNRFYAVIRNETSKLTGLDLITRNSATFKPNRLRNIKVYRKEDVTFSTVVVSKYKDEVTVLDPVTMITRVVLIPKGYTGLNEDVEEILIYRIDEDLILV